MKKGNFKLLTVCLVIGLIVGFGVFDKEALAKDYHFILINNMATISHFNPDYEGAQLACDELTAWTNDKVTYEVVGPAENDLLKQAESMEQAIAKKPDGFMVIAWDPIVIKSAINKAMKAGIPVVCIDADSPTSDRIAFIGTDWTELGTRLANGMIAALGKNPKGKIGMLGLVGADNMEQAFVSFKSAFAAYPDIEVLPPQHDEGAQATSARVAGALIQAHPDLIGIAGFDAESGPGISIALREANKVGKIKAVGNDLNLAQLASIADGSMQFIIGQKRVFFGYWGVLSLYIHLKTDLKFTSDDKTAKILNIPGTIYTGFLEGKKELAPLYQEAFKKWAEQ